jgi:hypothetical protein
MRRRICIVLTLVLSFLIMFSSPSIADEINVKTSKTADVEVLKAPLTQTNQIPSLPKQVEDAVKDLGKEKEDIKALRRLCQIPCQPNYKCNYFSGMCEPTIPGKAPGDAENTQ